MNTTIAAFLAAGCVPSEEQAVFGEIDGTDLLVDGAEEVFAERVLVVGNPAARLLPDGPALTEPSYAPQQPLPVVDPGIRPRVSIDQGDVRILLYLDRADLQPRVVGAVDGTGPEGDGRVQLPPGAAVEIVERGPERVNVTFETYRLTIDAWLPGAAVDEVWRYDEVAVTRVQQDPGGRYQGILGGTEILDRPSGYPLATVREDPDERPVLNLRVVGEEVRGYLPVIVDDWDVRIEGWVHADDLVTDLAGWGCSCGSGGGWIGFGMVGMEPSAIVPAGTLLRAGVDGPVVALATDDLQVPVEARTDGAVVTRHTSLGRVELWVGPEDVL